MIPHFLKHNNLSEQFLIDNVDYLGIDNVSMFFHLSENFVERYINRLNKKLVSKYQYVSDSLANKLKIDINKDVNTLYWDNKKKRVIVKK